MVVETFDPVDDVELSERTGVVAAQMNALNLQRLEEALHRRVVPATSSPAHRLNHLVVFDQLSVTGARILAASVRMHDQSGSRFS